MSRPITCAVLTNVPVPYRLPMWDALARTGDVVLHVIYCAEAHIDPTQDGRQVQGYTSHFLTAPYRIGEGNFAHADWGVTRLLSRIQPDVVVTTGFIWTYLFGYLWTRLHGVPHVTLTDGTAESEAGLSWAHRLVRRMVFAGTKAFVGASEGSWQLYARYGVPRDRFFKALLCIHNERFAQSEGVRSFDMLFSGRLIQVKNPLFAIEVARATARRLGRKVSLRILGKGVLEAEVKAHAQAAADEVDVTFSGCSCFPRCSTPGGWWPMRPAPQAPCASCHRTPVRPTSWCWTPRRGRCVNCLSSAGLTARHSSWPIRPRGNGSHRPRKGMCRTSISTRPQTACVRPCTVRARDPSTR